jgi:hypothetical protein
MRRRELLGWIAATTGCAVVGADVATALPASPPADMRIDLLDEIAETILPRTDTPGARDARVGAFIARYSAARCDEAQRATLRAGLADIEARSRKAFGRPFLRAGAAQKQALLARIDAEAKRHAKVDHGQPPHYFVLIKQLTLLGFFTSEAGATQVLRYRPIPGPYKGVVPYRKGEASWS